MSSTFPSKKKPKMDMKYMRGLYPRIGSKFKRELKGDEHKLDLKAIL